MAQTIAIPGRRVSQGETFYTDWTGRGGDCVILRVEVLIAAKVGSESVSFALETRGEDGGSTPTMVATYPVGGLELTGTGVARASTWRPPRPATTRARLSRFA